MVPALGIFLLFFFIPFFESFLLSFKSFDTDIYNPQWVGLANYTRLFHSPLFFKTLWNTVIYLIGAVPVLVIFPMIMAIAINQKIRATNFYKIVLYIPVVVSIVVAGIAWKWLYASEGLLNYFIGLFGVLPKGWLTDPDIALYSVIAVTVWKGLGYYMIIYLAALVNVPQELYEAADIDGANVIQKHLTVTVPHLIPTISLITIISSISALKSFVEIYVMTKGGPMNSSKTIVYYIYERAFENLDIGYASALGVVLLVIVMIFSMFNLKFFEQNAQGVQ